MIRIFRSLKSSLILEGKFSKYLLPIALTMSVACKKQRDTISLQTEITPQTAHPNAAALLTDDFYWSSIEETGPFGNDDGSDAFYSFREWRMQNSQSPVEFLHELFTRWDYPPFELTELNADSIQKIISIPTNATDEIPPDAMIAMKEYFRQEAKREGKEFDEKTYDSLQKITSRTMGATFLTGTDNAIIAVGFGQFVLEGKIDPDLKTLTRIALHRQLMPILLKEWDEQYQVTRETQLKKMLEAIEQMSS